ncbi:hypothetical protein ABW20_dc0101338 [Dactylellina cionopaga]|nr:hypothetical protein ABW20_dc0101338 [Dactylellina cionopaga]
MESRQQHQRQAEPPKDDENSDIFHSSKFFRGLLGVGVVFQAAIAAFLCSYWVVEGWSWSDNFMIEIVRFSVYIYGLLFLYNTTIWFVCVYYNKEVPRNSAFVAFEFARSIPWLIFAVGVTVLALPEAVRMIRERNREDWPGYPGSPDEDYIYYAVAIGVVVVLGGGLSLWSLTWMFVHFLKARQEEIQQLLKIAQKKSDETPAERAGDEEDGRNGIVNRESDETPLLIDQDQIV